ncbi:MAG TPA: AGE family epimerase/isomerase [Caulobacteraceae bacterium]
MGTIVKLEGERRAVAPLIAARDGLKAWLTQHAYPLWWRMGADRACGGFHDALALNGEPIAGDKRARVQARQAICYALAPDLGWGGPSAQATAHGLDFLIRRHRRADGLYRSRVAADGEAIGDDVDLYDQAFVLFALAAAKRPGDDRPLEAAEAVLARLVPHPLGGFRDFGGEALRANPNMHLLEAALAWIEAGGGPVWRAIAGGQARLAMDRLIDVDSGALSEFFDSDWRAPVSAAKRQVEPGHQFEWAWLLMRWSLIDGDAAALAAALRLIELAQRCGVDPARGVAIDALDGALAPRQMGARLWPQTERLKAAVLAGRITGDAGCWAMAADSAATLTRYLAVPTPGLWRDRLKADGAFIEEAAPASSFYHIVMAILELDRHAAFAPEGDST